METEEKSWDWMCTLDRASQNTELSLALRQSAREATREIRKIRMQVESLKAEVAELSRLVDQVRLGAEA